MAGRREKNGLLAETARSYGTEGDLSLTNVVSGTAQRSKWRRVTAVCAVVLTACAVMQNFAFTTTPARERPAWLTDISMSDDQHSCPLWPTYCTHHKDCVKRYYPGADSSKQIKKEMCPSYVADCLNYCVQCDCPTPAQKYCETMLGPCKNPLHFLDVVSNGEGDGTLRCPMGWDQVGALGYGRNGCGMDDCFAPQQADSIVECAVMCEERGRAGCKAFTFMEQAQGKPKCYHYTETKYNVIPAPGVPPPRIMCKINPQAATGLNRERPFEILGGTYSQPDQWYPACPKDMKVFGLGVGGFCCKGKCVPGEEIKDKENTVCAIEGNPKPGDVKFCKKYQKDKFGMWAYGIGQDLDLAGHFNDYIIRTSLSFMGDQAGILFRMASANDVKAKRYWLKFLGGNSGRNNLELTYFDGEKEQQVWGETRHTGPVSVTYESGEIDTYNEPNDLVKAVEAAVAKSGDIFHCKDGPSGKCYSFYKGCTDCGSTSNFEKAEYHPWNKAQAQRYCLAWANNRNRAASTVFGEGRCDDEFHCLNGRNGECTVVTVGQKSVGEHWCAREHTGKACACNGMVRYGMHSRWSTPRRVYGSVSCSNGVFGDPYPGTVKECRCTPANTMEAHRTQCHQKPANRNLPFSAFWGNGPCPEYHCRQGNRNGKCFSFTKGGSGAKSKAFTSSTRYRPWTKEQSRKYCMEQDNNKHGADETEVFGEGACRLGYCTVANPDLGGFTNKKLCATTTRKGHDYNVGLKIKTTFVSPVNGVWRFLIRAGLSWGGHISIDGRNVGGLKNTDGTFTGFHEARNFMDMKTATKRTKTLKDYIVDVKVQSGSHTLVIVGASKDMSTPAEIKFKAPHAALFRPLTAAELRAVRPKPFGADIKVKENTVYTVEIRMVGKKIQVSLDDAKTEELELRNDQYLAYGTIGFQTWKASMRADALRLDNINQEPLVTNLEGLIEGTTNWDMYVDGDLALQGKRGDTKEITIPMRTTSLGVAMSYPTSSHAPTHWYDNKNTYSWEQAKHFCKALKMGLCSRAEVCAGIRGKQQLPSWLAKVKKGLGGKVQWTAVTGAKNGWVAIGGPKLCKTYREDGGFSGKSPGPAWGTKANKWYEQRRYVACCPRAPMPQPAFTLAFKNPLSGSCGYASAACKKEILDLQRGWDTLGRGLKAQLERRGITDGNYRDPSILQDYFYRYVLTTKCIKPCTAADKTTVSVTKDSVAQWRCLNAMAEPKPDAKGREWYTADYDRSKWDRAGVMSTADYPNQGTIDIQIQRKLPSKPVWAGLDDGCIPKVEELNDSMANDRCGDAHNPVDRSADLVACDPKHTLDVRLAIANHLYYSCTAWCAYSTVNPAWSAYTWSPGKKCWARVSPKHACILKYTKERNRAVDRARRFCKPKTFCAMDMTGVTRSCRSKTFKDTSNKENMRNGYYCSDRRITPGMSKTRLDACPTWAPAGKFYASSQYCPGSFVASCRSDSFKDKNSVAKMRNGFYCTDREIDPDMSEESLKTCATWTSGNFYGSREKCPGAGEKYQCCEGSRNAACHTFWAGCKKCNANAFNARKYRPWGPLEAEKYCMTWSENKGKKSADVFHALTGRYSCCNGGRDGSGKCYAFYKGCTKCGADSFNSLTYSPWGHAAAQKWCMGLSKNGNSAVSDVFSVLTEVPSHEIVSCRSRTFVDSSTGRHREKMRNGFYCVDKEVDPSVSKDALKVCSSWTSGSFFPSREKCPGDDLKFSCCEGSALTGKCHEFWKGCEKCNTNNFNTYQYRPWGKAEAQRFCLSWQSNKGKSAGDVFDQLVPRYSCCDGASRNKCFTYWKGCEHCSSPNANGRTVSCRNDKYKDTANAKKMKNGYYCTDKKVDPNLKDSDLRLCATWTTGGGGFYPSSEPCPDGKGGHFNDAVYAPWDAKQAKKFCLGNGSPETRKGSAFEVEKPEWVKYKCCEGTAASAKCYTFWKGCTTCNSNNFNAQTYAPWGAAQANKFCLSWTANAAVKQGSKVFMQKGPPITDDNYDAAISCNAAAAKSEGWQNQKRLMHAFRMTGCPNKDASKIPADVWTYWKKNRELAFTDMYGYCELNRKNQATLAQKQACCGSASCPITRCDRLCPPKTTCDNLERLNIAPKASACTDSLCNGPSSTLKGVGEMCSDNGVYYSCCMSPQPADNNKCKDPPCWSKGMACPADPAGKKFFPSSDEEWKWRSVLLHTLQETGCPNTDPSKIPAGTWNKWGQDKLSAYADMFQMCQLNQKGTANVAQKTVCCGKAGGCKPAQCHQLCPSELKCTKEQAESKQWKSKALLMRALKMTGCPNTNPSHVPTNVWNIWQSNRDKAFDDMFGYCEENRLGSAKQYQKEVCCGKQSKTSEDYCAQECRAKGFCCNDFRTGSNQFVSCAQACMMRRRGATKTQCEAAVNDHATKRGCSRSLGGFTYRFCSRCNDLKASCPHGVQSKAEGLAGCAMERTSGDCRPATCKRLCPGDVKCNGPAKYWKSPSLLMNALNNVGCPNEDFKTLTSTVVAHWQSDFATAMKDMYDYCHVTMLGKATAAQQKVCCGDGRTCRPRSCTRKCPVNGKAGDCLIRDQYKRPIPGCKNDCDAGMHYDAQGGCMPNKPGDVICACNEYEDHQRCVACPAGKNVGYHAHRVHGVQYCKAPKDALPLKTSFGAATGKRACTVKDKWRLKHGGSQVEIKLGGYKYGDRVETWERCQEACKLEKNCAQVVYVKSTKLCYGMNAKSALDQDNKGGSNTDYISATCEDVAGSGWTECLSQCRNDGDCKQVVFQKSSKKCFGSSVQMKDAKPAKPTVEGRYRIRAELDQSCHVFASCRKKHQDNTVNLALGEIKYGGVAPGADAAKAWAACLEACKQESECKQVVFKEADKTCYGMSKALDADETGTSCGSASGWKSAQCNYKGGQQLASGKYWKIDDSSGKVLTTQVCQNRCPYGKHWTGSACVANIAGKINCGCFTYEEGNKCVQCPAGKATGTTVHRMAGAAKCTATDTSSQFRIMKGLDGAKDTTSIRVAGPAQRQTQYIRHAGQWLWAADGGDTCRKVPARCSDLFKKDASFRMKSAFFDYRVSSVSFEAAGGSPMATYRKGWFIRNKDGRNRIDAKSDDSSYKADASWVLESVTGVNGINSDWESATCQPVAKGKCMVYDNWRKKHGGPEVEIPLGSNKYGGIVPTWSACLKLCEQTPACKQVVYHKSHKACYGMNRLMVEDQDNKGGTNTGWISAHCNPNRRWTTVGKGSCSCDGTNIYDRIYKTGQLTTAHKDWKAKCEKQDGCTGLTLVNNVANGDLIIGGGVNPKKFTGGHTGACGSGPPLTSAGSYALRQQQTCLRLGRSYNFLGKNKCSCDGMNQYERVPISGDASANTAAWWKNKCDSTPGCTGFTAQLRAKTGDLIMGPTGPTGTKWKTRKKINSNECKVTVFYHNLAGNDDRDLDFKFSVEVEPNNRQPVTWYIAYGHWGGSQTENKDVSHTARDSFLVFHDAKGENYVKLIDNSGAAHYAENPRFSGACAKYFAKAPTGGCGFGPPTRTLQDNADAPGRPVLGRTYKIRSMASGANNLWLQISSNKKVFAGPEATAASFQIVTGLFGGLGGEPTVSLKVVKNPSASKFNNNYLRHAGHGYIYADGKSSSTSYKKAATWLLQDQTFDSSNDKAVAIESTADKRNQWLKANLGGHRTRLLGGKDRSSVWEFHDTTHFESVCYSVATRHNYARVGMGGCSCDGTNEYNRREIQNGGDTMAWWKTQCDATAGCVGFTASPSQRTGDLIMGFDKGGELKGACGAGPPSRTLSSWVPFQREFTKQTLYKGQKVYYCEGTGGNLMIKNLSPPFNLGVAKYAGDHCAEYPAGMTDEEAIAKAIRFCFSNGDCGGFSVAVRANHDSKANICFRKGTIKAPVTKSSQKASNICYTKKKPVSGSQTTSRPYTSQQSSYDDTECFKRTA